MGEGVIGYGEKIVKMILNVKTLEITGLAQHVHADHVQRRQGID